MGSAVIWKLLCKRFIILLLISALISAEAHHLLSCEWVNLKRPLLHFRTWQTGMLLPGPWGTERQSSQDPPQDLCFKDRGVALNPGLKYNRVYHSFIPASSFFCSFPVLTTFPKHGTHFACSGTNKAVSQTPAWPQISFFLIWTERRSLYLSLRLPA